MADEVKPVPQAPAKAPTQGEAKMTPETTDVPAMYFAVVSPDDASAVMDLVALVPENGTSTEPIAYKRKDKQWIPDEQIVRDLKSATPPPVVPLDDTVLDDILKQVDGLKEVTASGVIIASLLSDSPINLPEFSPFEELSAEEYALLEEFALQAAGGADRNRGNAEELRRDWTRGKGAAKIRWGTPGDWTRCVRQLSKYMGPRAKGYCQLRHKEVTGVYTGSKLNPGNDNKSFSYGFDENFSNAVVEQAFLTAKTNELKSRFAMTAAGGPSVSSDTGYGSEFSIQLVLPEDL
jgi:hypothetical protein